MSVIATSGDGQRFEVVPFADHLAPADWKRFVKYVFNDDWCFIVLKAKEG